MLNIGNVSLTAEREDLKLLGIGEALRTIFWLEFAEVRTVNVQM
jgi:hypothetical protein